MCSRITGHHETFRKAARENAIERFAKAGWIAQHQRVFEKLLEKHG